MKKTEHLRCLPRILISDGHASHLTFAMIKEAKENHVTILRLHAHITHLMQSFDKSVFKAYTSNHTSSSSNTHHHTSSNTYCSKITTPMTPVPTLPAPFIDPEIVPNYHKKLLPASLSFKHWKGPFCENTNISIWGEPHR